MKPAAKAYLAACYECFAIPQNKHRDNHHDGTENVRRAERLDGGCLLYSLDAERRHKKNGHGWDTA